MPCVQWKPHNGSTLKPYWCSSNLPDDRMPVEFLECRGAEDPGSYSLQVRPRPLLIEQVLHAPLTLSSYCAGRHAWACIDVKRLLDCSHATRSR
jgi:hypothetical protein